MNGQSSTPSIRNLEPERAQAAERRKQEAARVVANPSDGGAASMNQVQLFGGPIKVARMDSQSQHVTQVFGKWEDANLNPKSNSPCHKNGHGDSIPSDSRRPNHDPRHFMKRKPTPGDVHPDHRRSYSQHSSSGSHQVHDHRQSSASLGSSNHRSVSRSPASKNHPSSRPPTSQDGSGLSATHRNPSPSPVRNHHARHSSMPSVASGGTHSAPTSTGVPSTSSSMTHNHLASSANAMTSGLGSVVSPHHSSRPCGVKPTSASSSTTSTMHLPRVSSEKSASNPRVPPAVPNGALANKAPVPPVKRKDGLPKLKMPDVETPHENIDEILKEMTQLHAPLTAIDTPLRSKANFPFPSSGDKTPPAADTGKAASAKTRDMEQDERNKQLIEDLSLSDDSEEEEPTPVAHNVEPESRQPEKTEEEPMNVDAADSSREDNMSSSSDSSSEESDSTDSSGSESSSDNGEDDDDEEEKEKSKPEENIAPLEEKPQQKSWGLKSFMVAHTPPLNFSLPPMVPEKKSEDAAAADAAPQKNAKASEEPSKGSSSSAGTGRKSREANRSTTVPFSAQEPEEFLVKELGLGQRGNGVPTPEDARPADKAPASVASLQSPSTTSEGSTSSKKASSGSKQKTPRSRSSPGSAKAQETQHKKTPSVSSAKNTAASSSSSSKKESSSSSSSKSGASSAKTSAVSAPVSTQDKKTSSSSSSKTKGSRGKTKPKSRQLISDSDSDSEMETSSVVTATNKASSNGKKGVVSERDLIAMQLFSGDSSSPTPEKQEEAVKSVSAAKDKSNHGKSKSSSSSKSSKTTNHKKRDREASAEAKASDKKSSSSKRSRASSTSSKSKDSGSTDNPPFKPPEPLSPLPQSDSGAGRERTQCPAAVCPGPVLNSKRKVLIAYRRTSSVPPPNSSSSSAFSPSAPHSKPVMPSPRQPSSRDTQGHHSKTPSHRPAAHSPADSRPSIDGTVAQQPSPCGSQASTSSRSSSHKHKRSRSKSEQDPKECSSAKQAKMSSSSRSSHKSPSTGHAHSSSSSSQNHGGSSSLDKRKRPHGQSSSSHNGHSSSKIPCRSPSKPFSPTLPPHASSHPTQKPKEVPQENGLTGATSSGEKKPDSRAERFLSEAKRIKHEADAEPDPLWKLLRYTEALVEYIKAVQTMDKSEEQLLKDFYSGILSFIKFVPVKNVPRVPQCPTKSKVVTIWLKTAALVAILMYRQRKHEMDKYRSQLETKYQEICHQSEKSQSRQCFPSPQTNSWTSRMSNVPSPSSPAPSPAGSTASLGSQGSNDVMPRNNGSTAPHAPILTSTVTIPTRIFQMQQEDFRITSYLVHAHEYWDQALTFQQSCRDFIQFLERECGGPLTLDSPVEHLVNYIGKGVRKIRMEQNL